MNDQEWVKFLQWLLPKMRMYWPGFRKVRKKVIKRINKRMQILQLADLTSYQYYLESHPEEWTVLDNICRVSISRFYRDKLVFYRLEHEILPLLTLQALRRGEKTLRIWSAGSASGEEPYSLAILWVLCLQIQFPEQEIEILATEAESKLLQRAETACYSFSSIKNLPGEWRDKAFVQAEEFYCLRPEYKKSVTLLQHDIREPPPNGPFHMILCRNLVFTYYEHELQCELAERLWQSLVDGGMLVLGVHESLPEEVEGFIVLSRRLGLYQKH